MRTKIVATLGPASMNHAAMRAMVRHGARIFRCNFSHDRAEAFTDVVRWTRQLEQEFGIRLTVMGDLSGPKLRIGEVAGSPLAIQHGDRILLGLAGKTSPDHKDLPCITLDDPAPLSGLEQDMPVSLSDGMLRFHVEKVLETDMLFVLKAENAGLLTSHKGIAFPGKFHPLPAFTEKDRRDLREGLEVGLDAFAQSFVQGPDDLDDVHAEMDRLGVRVPLVAKLERRQALDRLDEILERCDAVMVARGDLGLEMPLISLPVHQKRIIKACRRHSKAAIVATQMLLSMVKNPIPTRAETTDVANAVLDGADCVMLSEETAIGEHPVEAVRILGGIAKEAETYYHESSRQTLEARVAKKGPSEYLAYAAALLAETASGTALVCHTASGATARRIASRRPGPRIYAVTPNEHVTHLLNFYADVTPAMADTSMERHVARAERFIENCADIHEGETVIITSGQPTPGQLRARANADEQPPAPTNELKIYIK
ncbi:pyruvate kinase [Oceanidesulfovibrio marinus]|uniref:Pyruvate kinase n=1 Tax=Oceanidesulfovibrio marinus TaxID=370038 RepID=A0A6P1ZLP8_9BACT|nr:pyruvate kinase [Oceanidesulfovibrio marinus]QJT11273.1 pyruvate kinase [Oceanidesulfovibrio marinus]TVM36871.1 pyruvate kinase [Oceanidesulfovibrio marinus]